MHFFRAIGQLPYLFVFKPLGLIYEVGLRFKFKPPGAYKRNVLILNAMCSTRLFGTLNNAELPRNIRGLYRPTIKCGLCNAELIIIDV